MPTFAKHMPSSWNSQGVRMSPTRSSKMVTSFIRLYLAVGTDCHWGLLAWEGIYSWPHTLLALAASHFLRRDSSYSLKSLCTGRAWATARSMQERTVKNGLFDQSYMFLGHVCLASVSVHDVFHKLCALETRDKVCSFNACASMKFVRLCLLDSKALWHILALCQRLQNLAYKFIYTTKYTVPYVRVTFSVCLTYKDIHIWFQDIISPTWSNMVQYRSCCDKEATHDFIIVSWMRMPWLGQRATQIDRVALWMWGMRSHLHCIHTCTVWTALTQTINLSYQLHDKYTGLESDLCLLQDLSSINHNYRGSAPALWFTLFMMYTCTTFFDAICLSQAHTWKHTRTIERDGLQDVAGCGR